MKAKIFFLSLVTFGALAVQAQQIVIQPGDTVSIGSVEVTCDQYGGGGHVSLRQLCPQLQAAWIKGNVIDGPDVAPRIAIPLYSAITLPLPCGQKRKSASAPSYLTAVVGLACWPMAAQKSASSASTLATA